MERALPLPWPPEGECGHRNADGRPEPGPVGPRLAVSTELTGSNQSVAEPTLPNELVLGVLFVFVLFCLLLPYTRPSRKNVDKARGDGLGQMCFGKVIVLRTKATSTPLGSGP